MLAMLASLFSAVVMAALPMLVVSLASAVSITALVSSGVTFSCMSDSICMSVGSPVTSSSARPTRRHAGEER